MSDLLDRVAHALALADGASTNEEREAALAMAQRFARLGQIELADARRRNKDKERETPENRRVQVNHWNRKNHRPQFAALFLAIAHVNDVRCLMSERNYYVFPYGFPSDLDITEALFVTLSVQMEAAADAAIRRGDHKRVIAAGDEYWSTVRHEWVVAERLTRVAEVDGRVWRGSFYDGFIAGTSGRLWAAREAADAEVDAAAEAAGTTSTALAMRDKAAEVEDYYKAETERQWKRLGTWKQPEPAADSPEARWAGAAAARAASLGDEDSRGMPTGTSRPAIGSDRTSL